MALSLTRRLVFALLCLSALCVCAPLPGRAVERKNCEVCRRFIDAGQCRMRVLVDLGHNHTRSIETCSPFCLFERLEDYKHKENATIGTVLVMPYSEHDELDPLMTNAEKCWFLYETKGESEQNADPICAAYRSERQAKQAKEEMGGEVVNWDTLSSRLTKLAEDYEPDGHTDEGKLLGERQRDP